MDPLSLLGAISSVASLAGAGAQLSLYLLDVSQKIGGAGDELRDLGIDVSLFCDVLKRLQKVLAADAGKAPEARRASVAAVETAQQIVDRCRGVFASIDDVVRGLGVKAGREGELTLDLAARIKWVLKRGKIQTYRATLESCKITLVLMVSTLAFADTVARRRYSNDKTAVEDAEEEVLVRSLATAQKRANEKLAAVEIDDERRASGESHYFDSAIARYRSASIPHRNRIILAGDGDGESSAGAISSSSLSRQSLATPSELSNSDDETQRLASIVSFDLPFQRPPERASVWLNRLILEDVSCLSSRQPSVQSTESAAFAEGCNHTQQIEHFLSKWTDQGQYWSGLRGAHGSDASRGANWFSAPQGTNVSNGTQGLNGFGKSHGYSPFNDMSRQAPSRGGIVRPGAPTSLGIRLVATGVKFGADSVRREFTLPVSPGTRPVLERIADLDLLHGEGDDPAWKFERP